MVTKLRRKATRIFVCYLDVPAWPLLRDCDGTCDDSARNMLVCSFAGRKPSM